MRTRPSVVLASCCDTVALAFREHPDDYLLFLGRFTEGKGVLHAIDVAKRAGMRLILAAADNDYYRDAVASQVDGTQIVYTRRYVNKLEDRFDGALWIMNADGSKNRFLAKGGGARWSPDGTRIAYLNDGEPRGTQIFVHFMDADRTSSQITRVDQAIGQVAVLRGNVGP